MSGGYVVTTIGPSIVGNDCECADLEPCPWCEDAAADLMGTRVADATTGNRTFVVEDVDSKDGRVTVAGTFFWAYLDDVRPVVSRQEVDGPGGLGDALHELGLSPYSIKIVAAALRWDGVATHERDDGSTITVEPKPQECCWMGCHDPATRVAERDGSRYPYCDIHPTDPEAAGLTFEPITVEPASEDRWWEGLDPLVEPCACCGAVAYTVVANEARCPEHVEPAKDGEGR